MSQFYTSLAAMANRLLAEKGQAVTLARHGALTYDPSTGGTSGSPTTETGVAAVLTLSDDAKASLNRLAQSVVETGQAKLVLGTTGISKAPGVGDTITGVDETGASVVWAVKNCDTIGPGGPAVIYICQVER